MAREGWSAEYAMRTYADGAHSCQIANQEVLLGAGGESLCVEIRREYTHIPRGGLHAFNTRVDRTNTHASRGWASRFQHMCRPHAHHTSSLHAKLYQMHDRIRAPRCHAFTFRSVYNTYIRMFGNLGFGVSVNLDAHVEVDRQIITFVVSIFFLLFFPPPLLFLFFVSLLLLPFFAHVEVARGLGGHVQVLHKGAMDLTVT